MIYEAIAYILLTMSMLAIKDADSYLLFDRSPGPLVAARTKRWHLDGTFLFCLIVAILCRYNFDISWKIAIAAALVRLSLFDLIFNIRAKLPITALGGTAWWDEQEVKIFGKNGAILKSALALAILIGLIFLNHFA